jgi:hypothetical protein
MEAPPSTAASFSSTPRIDLFEKVALFKRFADAYYLSVRQGGVRHPLCMGMQRSRFCDGFSIGSTINPDV